MQEQIHFPNHLGEKLAGTLHIPPIPTQYGVVIGHCFTCSRNTFILRRLSDLLEQAGFFVLRFDFSGNGQSEGSFSESIYSKQIKEVDVGVEYITAQGARWIGLAGHSLGAMIALLAGSQMDQVQAICTLAARASTTTINFFLNQAQRSELSEQGSTQFVSRGRSLEITRTFFADAARYNLERTVRNLQKSLLIVHGDRDQIIPQQDALNLWESSSRRATLKIIPGADHMFSNEEHRKMVARFVTEWFTGQKDR